MEELDLNTNNLCTTEDAFEEFQSGAMYEENEFITLSDIVSPPHNNQDVNLILHDDPCDEVSLSIQDEKTVNNVTIPLFEQDEVFDCNSQTKDQNNKDKTRTPKRRGRKKKGSYENSEVQPQCQIDLKPPKPKRQSRKSIIASDTNDLKYVEDCVFEEPECAIPVNKSANKAPRKYRNTRKGKEEHVKKGKQAKHTSKRKRKESVHEDKNSQIITSTMDNSNINITVLTSDNKTIKHRRGRKKQNISSQNPVVGEIEVPAKKCEIKSVIPTTENNDLENNISILPLYDETSKSLQLDGKPPFTVKKTVKNSIAAKKVKKYNSDEDTEDLPLSNLSKNENGLNINVDTEPLENENEQYQTLENMNSPESNIHSKIKTSNGKEKVVKKRGRPKKNSDAKTDLQVKKLTTKNTEKLDNINDASTEQQNKFDKPDIISDPDIISEPMIFDDNEPQVNISTESNSQQKRSSKKKIIPDFEYNVDSLVKPDSDITKLHEDLENLDTEDSSRRPVRRRVLKNWNYDEGSDEDPYANVESSDDEPRRRKKGGRCYSDDEYFPGDKRQFIESESDFPIDGDLGSGTKPQKKKRSRASDLATSKKSPRKKGRKSDAESMCTTERTNTNTDSGDVDFEDYGDSSIIRGADDQVTPTKSQTNEFENFIAKIVQGTDIKISKKSVDVRTTLQIPVIEATEAKKNIDKSAQTGTVTTKQAGVQTDTPYEIPMKDQVPLSGEQSERACDFLSSIVQTTAELGQLMTQKSKDFINKKINTKYVTDTFKMDYCVKKSFLLFKLAKHNLVQMEEDLSKQYEEFLRENNLIQHRQEPKIIASTSKFSDSDCEIVEEPVKRKTPPKAQKPAFNPKTVFLNKELSIKIAKKPPEEPAPKKKLNIKGSHSVWINDSILVKKVKPNQSFLAQDSRNKKPPDNITLEQVHRFFKMYERQKALFICAPYIKTEWFGRERRYMCNYFVDSTTDFPEKTTIMQNENVTEVAFVDDPNHVIGKNEESIDNPETLSLLCTKVVQNCIDTKQDNTDNISSQNVNNQRKHVKTNSRSLKNVDEANFLISDINKNIICLKPNGNASTYVSTYVQPLKTVCFKRILDLMSSEYFNDNKPKLTANVNKCMAAKNDANNIIKVERNDEPIKPLLSLLAMCVKTIQDTQNVNIVKCLPKSLKSISLFKVVTLINGNSIANNTDDNTLLQMSTNSTNILSYENTTNNTSLEPKNYNVNTLMKLCIDATNISREKSITNNTGLESNYYNVKTLRQLCKEALKISSYGNSTKNTSLEQSFNAETLLKLCKNLPNISHENSVTSNISLLQCYNVKTLRQLCKEALKISSYGNSTKNTSLEQSFNAETLLKLCKNLPNISYENSVTSNISLLQCYNVKTLRQLCKEALKISSYGNSTKNTSLEQSFNAETLLKLCKNLPNISYENSVTSNISLLQCYNVKTLRQLCKDALKISSYGNSTKNTSLEQSFNAETLLKLCKNLPNISHENSVTSNISLLQCYNVKTLRQLCKEAPKISHENSVTSNISLLQCYNVKTLRQLCKEALKISSYGNSTKNTSLEQSFNAETLLKLCKNLPNISHENSVTSNISMLQCYNVKTLRQLCKEAPKISHENSYTKNTSLEQSFNAATLLKLCKISPNISKVMVKEKKGDVELFLEENNPQVHSVMSLKSICRYKIAELSTEWYKRQCLSQKIKTEKTLNFTINNVDGLLDDASGNDLGDLDDDVESSYNEEELDDDNMDVNCRPGYNDVFDDNNWVSQVQMQELRSCLDTTRHVDTEDKISGINESKGQDSIVQIKMEPKDYQPECVDSTNIKTEPLDEHEYMGEGNFPSINVITKQENIDEDKVRREPICRQSGHSYDQEVFESFVSSNKMIVALNDYGSKSDEIFSQSSQRVRRQYEPDLEDDTDVLTDTMNLLVPQNVESKDRLMESSQEEDEEIYKKNDKKKSEKRKCKSKKSNKDLQNKNKMLQKNQLVTNRKIKDKIRQKHDKSEPSDSETDSLKLSLKIDKEKSRESKSNNDSKEEDSKEEDSKEEDSKEEDSKEEEKVIQCNDVDSTELIPENKSNTLQNKIYEDHDQDNTESVTDERSSSLGFNEPVEHLECEPTLPIFEELYHQDNYQHTRNYTSDTSYVDRHGWQCYPIDKRDDKIYAHAHIELDKLPPPFIDTYFQCLDETDKTNDLEIDRVTNQESLQRSKEENDINEGIPTIIEEKTKPNTSKITEFNEEQLKKEKPDISPFEEESNIDKYIPSTMQSPENIAKNLLINDDTEETDVETKNTEIKIEKSVENSYKTRFGRTVKHKIEKAKLEEDDLMLTADKMMNKELALLHAPFNLKEEEDTKDPVKRLYSKNAQKNASKGQTRYRIKTDDDSSSEEEKQWFTTKERLLKRLLKKNEDANVEDAKRAKIVSEFIEKRGELPEPRQRARARQRCKNKRTTMERRKQIKLLSRELFGDDTVYSKKYSQASTSKGRRNIRKVIDKKSLARSTVVANMEEFERKKRLTLRQAQLREDLDCEEGVNVVVINDELCLEYDFEEKRPVVSVHQFFTKVMKAHQYEGVKFMWDACFESVSLASGGDPGGGCILAHCMGLGKTLQVLALLHTVLTHPEVGMRRVLVCCPLSTVLNWVDEIHKWIGPVTKHIKVFELSKLKKTYERAYQLEDWYTGGGIFIIGYELFRSLSTLDPGLDCVRPTIVNKIRTALLDPGPDIIVCDEGHLLKNDCSVLALAMSRVVTKRRIMLTGTPMQNNLREYYCMVNFVKPNLLGSYSEYSNRFENPIMNGQHRDSREEDIKLMKARTHILHKVLEGCLQRQEASVLYPYLPKKYEYTVFISLTKCQWELYKHYLTNCVNTKENKQSVLRDFHVLQKIWTHPLVLNNFLMKTRDDKESKTKVEKLVDDLEEAPEQVFCSAAAWWARTEHQHMLHQLDSSYKFLVVFQLLHECVELGDKVLIFSTSLYAMDALEFFLNRERKWTLGREYYRLDGSVPAEVRQKWCREFNAPQNTSTKLFLISTRAGSLGLNMTAANRVIILDTSWNPAHDIQSIFRVYRFGQKKDCYIYRLVAMGTMEQKIYERSVTKQAVSCRVVDEQQIDRHYNMAELSELYRLDEAGSGVCAGVSSEVRDASLVRVAAVVGGLHAVHEHDSLLRGSSEAVLPEHERNAAWMQFQQEHATTHIRNFEINVSKQSAEDAKVEAKQENIKPEKDNETNSDETTKIIKKYKRKTKNKNIEPKSNPQPSTSRQDSNPAVEEGIIKIIMDILIKHNFHTTKTPDEIASLVMNVRDVVAQAPKPNLDDVDPLTESIARVLLEKDITLPEVKTERTDNDDDNKIDSDDDGNTNFQDRKRRRNRRDSDEEYLPDARKRKSAKTRKSIESVNSDNHYVDVTDVISNKEVLDKNIVSVGTSEHSEITSKKTTETNKSLEIDEKVTKQINKKDKSKDDVNIDNCEIIENEPSKETEIISNKEEPVVIRSSDTNSKITSESNDTIIYTLKHKQRKKKFKLTKSEVNKEKQSNICQREEKEPSNDNTDNISNKEEFEQEQVVISLKKIKTFSKKSSESDHIAEIDDKTNKRNIDKFKIIKNYGNKNKQRSYIIEQGSSKNSETNKQSYKQNEIVEIDDDADKHTNKTCINAKSYASKQENNIHDENDSSNECIEIDDNTNKNTNEYPVQQNESICLSDDDEPIIQEPPPHQEENMVEKDINEIIPLHKSVLTNNNFIKLVAHTYLTGNPMLDEDAALLAAQYSTLKALKEVQATGNNLTSGPIYDIAVKVLGKAVMKRLFAANTNKFRTETMLLETENVQNKTMNDMFLENTKLKSVDSEVNKKTDTKICKRKLGRKATIEDDQSTSKSIATETSQGTANVVPVGIFKATPSQRSSIEECILPDDDEVIITTTPPALAKNCKELLVNTKECSGDQLQEPVPTASIQTAKALPSTIENSHVTICLDSDEEDDKSLDSCTFVSPLVNSNKHINNDIKMLPVRSTSPSASTDATNTKTSNNEGKTKNKLKYESKCNIGDIIRINELGKVDILQRKTGISQLKVTKIKDPATYSSNKEKVAKNVISTNKQQIKDNLSVLKNVIHIPASKYEKKSSNPVEKSNPIPLPPKQADITKSSNPNQLEIKSISRNSQKVNDNQIKKKIITKKSISINASDVKEVVIDLTEPQQIQVIPGVSLSEVFKDPGTAKVSSVVTEPKKPAILSKSVSKVSSRCSSAGECKRPSPWSDAALSKKLRTETKTKMALSDFNLDEFDDIIELE